MRAGGVLGRLARLFATWLRGLARRLDRAAGGAQMPPAVLAALAERFPGAPEHWLADVARQMIAAGEEMPSIDASPLPPESRPAEPHPRHRPMPDHPKAKARRRQTLSFIGDRTGRTPMASGSARTPKRSPSPLRWSNSAGATREPATFQAGAATHRPGPDFPLEERLSQLPATDSSSGFRAAERLANLPPAADRGHAEPTFSGSARSIRDMPAMTAIHRLATRIFVSSPTSIAPDQQAGFAVPDSGAVTHQPEFPGAAERPTSPVAFATAHPARRPTLSFPHVESHRASADWGDISSAGWPALPPHDQTIADAPTPSFSPADHAREQMAGRWSA